jgi:hypothetical protein
VKQGGKVNDRPFDLEGRSSAYVKDVCSKWKPCCARVLVIRLNIMLENGTVQAAR